jgi:excisionase family DNA binding protein
MSEQTIRLEGFDELARKIDELSRKIDGLAGSSAAGMHIHRDTFYTVDELATLMGCTRQTVHRRIREEGLRAKRLGDTLCVKGEWLLDWMDCPDAGPASRRRKRVSAAIKRAAL